MDADEREPIDDALELDHDSMVTAGVIEAHLAKDFDHVRLIGKGGFAYVFAALQRSTGREIAVKVFPSHIVVAEPADCPEVRAHAKVSWHSNVITLFDAGRMPTGHLWMALELAQTTLRYRMRRDPLTPDDVLLLAQELVSAVRAVHRAGAVHGDLKPSNVLLASDRSARLSDFGTSHLLDLTLPTISDVGVTIRYGAPEVLRGSRPTMASDIYSLGMTLWAAAHGRHPFEGLPAIPEGIAERAEHAPPPWDPPPTFTGPVADRLRTVIELCLVAAPRERPSGDELRSLLERPLRPATEAVPAAPRPRSARPDGRRASWSIAALGGVAALLTTALVIGSGTTPTTRSRPSAPVLGRTTCERIEADATAVGAAMDAATTGIVASAAVNAVPDAATAQFHAFENVARAVETVVDDVKPMLAADRELRGQIGQLQPDNITRYMLAVTLAQVAPQPSGQGQSGTASTVDAFTKLAGEVQQSCRSTDLLTWIPKQAQLAAAAADNFRQRFFEHYHDHARPPAFVDMTTKMLDLARQTNPAYLAQLLVDKAAWTLTVLDADDGCAGGQPSIRCFLTRDAGEQLREASRNDRGIAARVLERDLFETVTDGMDPPARADFRKAIGG